MSTKKPRAHYGRLTAACFLVFAVALATLFLATDVFERHTDKAQSSMSFALSDYQTIETRANTFTGNVQHRSAIAADSDGNLLVSWASRRQERGTYGVFAQRFDPLGRPLGTEIHVNQFMPGYQSEPAVSFDPNGTAWIAWQSLGQDGSLSGIFMRPFGMKDGEFQALGDETRVNTTIDGEQITPSIASNGNGQTLVAWSTFDERGDLRTAARIFNSDGSPVTDELSLSASGAGEQDRLPVAVSLPGGEFVVAWAHTSADGEPDSIVARIVSSSHADRDAFAVSEKRDGCEQIEPSIAADSNGNIVVAWLRSGEPEGYDVVARRLNADGSTAGDVIVVSDRKDGWKSGAAVAMAEDGRFVVSYNLLGEKEEDMHKKRPKTAASIYARVFDMNGVIVSDEFKVSQHEKGPQKLPVASNAARALWSAHGQIAFAWAGRSEGDGSAAGLTLFAPKTLDIAPPPAVEPVAAAVDVARDETRVPPDFNPDWVPQDPVVDLTAVGPDFGFMAFQTTAWQPPDNDCAAGPDHIVSVVNMDIRVHTKAGLLLSDELLEDFFASTSGGDFLFDPVAAYDHHADRFVIATADHQGSADGLNVAVSKTNDPTDGWHKYYFDTDSIGDYIDFENLGIGTDAYYITADYFGSYENVIHIFDKAPMLIGAPVTIKYLNTTTSGLMSLGAVKTYDANPPAQYFASSWVSSSSLRIYAVRNATTTPILDSTNVSVSYFSNPPDATQKGSSNKVSTIDDRIKNGVYRNGSLWLTHSIGENNTARVRWYEIRMNNWPVSGSPTLVQEGTLNYGSGEHNWFPDITVSDDDDAVITCCRSSANDYPYIARTGRKFYDDPDTFRVSSRLKESDGPTTSSRWGDYSGNDEDPVDPGVVWSHTIYNTTGSDWRGWVGKTDTDKLMIHDDPGVIYRGSSVTLNVHGAHPGGWVFFTYSRAGAGSTYIPGLDATLDLASPVSAGARVVDANGDVTITKWVPTGAVVGPIYLQAIETNNTSNVITTTIN